MKNFLFLHRIKTDLIYLVLFLVIIASANSQDTIRNSREIVLDSICVNGIPINNEDPGALVLTTSDSISIYYHCLVNEGEKTPFLFKTILKYDNESYSKTHNSSVISYKDLPEENFEFMVSAFDLQRNWVTDEEVVSFRVNDNEAKLLKEVSVLNAKIGELSKKEKELPVIVEEKSNNNIWQLLTGSLIGAAFVIFTFFVVRKTKPKKHREPETQDMRNNSSVPKTEFNKVLHDNSNLKAEIAALRGQIDALSLRANELKKRNRELEESILFLTNSKKELEELQVQKDELFTVIIHDIKNPAALIKNLVELLTSYDLTTNEQQEVISDIVNTTSKIVSLSQEVSRILALEGGKMHLDFEKIEIASVVNDVTYRNKIAAGIKGISITVDADCPELNEVPCDPFKIDEVLDNLISNAIKFTQQSGSIHVRCYESDDSAVIEVSDNGLGLSEDDIKSAFKRGSKLSAKPTAGENSTGLGLWIVKKIMDAHNGRVWVKSSMGKGSTFSISIPLDNKEGKVELDLQGE